MNTKAKDGLSLDIIIPVYNESESIETFHQQLSTVIDELHGKVRILYVNDGSTDNTGLLIDGIAERDPRVAIIELTRNFGHQAALSAGFDVVDADYIITMDGDGQHPPELIPRMLQIAEQGYDLVITQRVDSAGVGWLKRWTSTLFYKILNFLSATKLVKDSADFRLYRRHVLDELRRMKEYHRFIRGMTTWLGFSYAVVPFHERRRIGGKPKYTWRKMVKFAMDAVFSFSLVPLYIALFIGFLFILLAIMEIVYILILWFAGDRNTIAPGWSSLMFVLLFVGGVIMVTLGVLGMYVGYIYQQVKERPVYVVRRRRFQDGGE